MVMATDGEWDRTSSIEAWRVDSLTYNLFARRFQLLHGDKVAVLQGVTHTCDLRASDTMMRRNVAIIAVAVCSHLSIVNAQCNLTGSWTGSGSGQPGPLIEVGEPGDACKRSNAQPHLTALLHCCTHTRHSALAHPPPVHHTSLHCCTAALTHVTQHSLTHHQSTTLHCTALQCTHSRAPHLSTRSPTTSRPHLTARHGTALTHTRRPCHAVFAHSLTHSLARSLT